VHSRVLSHAGKCSVRQLAYSHPVGSSRNLKMTGLDQICLAQKCMWVNSTDAGNNATRSYTHMCIGTVREY
jgi:hypothetical protein